MPNQNYSTDSNTIELVKLVQNGDEKAFTDIYENHFQQLRDFAVSIIYNEEVAKELVQDVFLSIWVNRQEWQPKGSIKSYLYRSVKNRSLDYLKHKIIEREWQKTKNFTNKLDTETPHELYVSSELEKVFQQAINELPERRKMIFILSRVNNLKYREIADVLNISIKTVEHQMGDALKKLHEEVRRFLVN